MPRTAGVCGGNIPGNTLEAFEAALAQGAGVIELDVSQSADGELFVFHPRHGTGLFGVRSFAFANEYGGD